EISPGGRRFLRALIRTRQEEFARVKQDLWLADYVQVPPSIGQFLSDAYYLGQSLAGVGDSPGLWPTWRGLLIQQFDLDSFIHNLVLTGAIGVGKTLALVALILFRICVCLHLRDPFGYFGLARGSTMVFLLLSVSKDTLRATAWSRALRLMASSPFFRERCGYDPDQGHDSMKIPLQFVAPELSGVHVTLCGGSKRQHLIGRDVLVVGMDESNSRLEADPQAAAYELFSDARVRMASRFQRHCGFMPGLSIVASSAGDESSFTEKIIKENEASADCRAQGVVRRAIYRMKPDLKLKPWWFKVAYGRPNDEPIVLRGAYSPEAHPLAPPPDCPFASDALHDPTPEGTATELIPGDFFEEFARHPRRALQQLSGISVGGTHRLFPTMADIERCLSLSILEGILDANRSQLMPMSDEDDRHVWDYLNHRAFVTRVANGFEPRRHPARLRYVHLDLATTGKAGLTVCHLAGPASTEANPPPATDQLGRSFTVEFDFILTITGGRTRPIAFDKIKEFLVWLREMCGFRFGKVTADSYQSTYLLQTLEAQGFTTGPLSVDRDKSPYLALRAGFEAGRIRLYRQLEFMREAAQLLEMERKICHPSEGSKDTTDAAAGAYANAIGSEEIKILSISTLPPAVEGIRPPRGNATPEDPFGLYTGIPPRKPRNTNV
ncbi:MAG: hypothetical protein NT154_20980, partial [Verrucomicrobia bacterium]|nr:hypothetical protein [Verrucomicrobiota bacterium]